MKNIFSIVLITILFIASLLIFWAGFWPKSFSEFFSVNTLVNQKAREIGILNIKNEDYSSASSSEPVISSAGQIKINNNVWSVEIVSKDGDRAKGLSNRQVLYNKKGMLFAFDKMEFHPFWMKDMLIPLDIIFFDDNWKIVLIESNLQPNTFPKSFGGDIKSKYVLEINALEAKTYNMKVGDQAFFSNK